MFNDTRMKIFPSLFRREHGCFLQEVAVYLLDTRPSHEFSGREALDEIAAKTVRLELLSVAFHPLM